MFTREQTAIVKGLLARGDKQHDIAAYFGENGGRVGEVASGYITRNGKRTPHPHRDVPPAPARQLPPPAQIVPWGFIMDEARKAIGIAEIGLASARDRINDIEARLLAAMVVLKRRKPQ